MRFCGAAATRRILAGIYALAVLPTTVSSCIVFTQLARGNVVATIFNASLANVAGVFLSPLLLSLLLQQSGRALPSDELVRVLSSLALRMLLPVALGQVARAVLREWAQRHGKKIGVFMNAAILAIIWFSFSRPARDPAFAASLLRLWPLFVYLAVSHLLLLGAAWGGGRALRLDKANTYTVLFVAPQKTLAMGAPLLTTYFATMPDLLGVALLPLIMYHLWQLTVAGFLPPPARPGRRPGTRSRLIRSTEATKAPDHQLQPRKMARRWPKNRCSEVSARAARSRSMCCTMSAAYSIPPRIGSTPAWWIASVSCCRYRSRLHFWSAARQPRPNTSRNAAPSRSSQRSMWGSGTARIIGAGTSKLPILAIRALNPWQFASVATTIKSGHGAPCRLMSRR